MIANTYELSSPRVMINLGTLCRVFLTMHKWSEACHNQVLTRCFPAHRATRTSADKCTVFNNCPGSTGVNKSNGKVRSNQQGFSRRIALSAEISVKLPLYEQQAHTTTRARAILRRSQAFSCYIRSGGGKASWETAQRRRYGGDARLTVSHHSMDTRRDRFSTQPLWRRGQLPAFDLDRDVEVEGSTPGRDAAGTGYHG